MAFGRDHFTPKHNAGSYLHFLLHFVYFHIYQVILPVILAPRHTGKLNNIDLWLKKKKKNIMETCRHDWAIWRGFTISSRERMIIIIYSVSPNTESVRHLVINSNINIVKKQWGKIIEGSSDICYIQMCP